MNVADLENRVRVVLMDNHSPYRWSSEFIRTAIEDAVVFLHAARPETRYVNGLLTDGVALPQNSRRGFSHFSFSRLLWGHERRMVA